MLGKIIGGALGFFVGGPIGAAAGVVAGNAFDTPTQAEDWNKLRVILIKKDYTGNDSRQARMLYDELFEKDRNAIDGLSYAIMMFIRNGDRNAALLATAYAFDNLSQNHWNAVLHNVRLMCIHCDMEYVLDNIIQVLTLSGR